MTRRTITAAALLFLAACGTKNQSQTAAADSANRDLQLAPAESTVALNDNPSTTTPPAASTPAPTTPPVIKPKPKPAPTTSLTPTPAPVAAKPSSVTLASGTEVYATSNDSLHSRHNKAGETFTATVSNDVTDAKGNVGIPQGAVITFDIVTLEPAKSSSAKDGTIKLRVKDITYNGHSVAANAEVKSIQHTLQGQGVTAGGAARVGGGAAAGAIAGKVIGGKTGAIIGGIAGAGGGAILAAKTADRDVVVAPGAAIVLALTTDVTIQN